MFGFRKSSGLGPAQRGEVLMKVRELVDKEAIRPEPRTVIAQALLACGHRGHGPDSKTVTDFMQDLTDYAVPSDKKGTNIVAWWPTADKATLLERIKAASGCVV